MNDEVLFALGNSLEGKTVLENLKIQLCLSFSTTLEPLSNYCRSSELTDVGLFYLSEGLKQVTSLRNLSLIFPL